MREKEEGRENGREKTKNWKLRMRYFSVAREGKKVKPRKADRMR